MTELKTLIFHKDQFSIIDFKNTKFKAKIKTKKHKNHLSKPSKMSCFSFDLPLSVCKSECNYFKNEMCYVQNNKLHESFTNRKKILIRNLKLSKSDNFVKILTEQIRNKKQRIFRFFSSGDFIDFEHMLKIIQVTRNLKNVNFWISTKNEYVLREYFINQKLSIPENCHIILSSPKPMLDLLQDTKNFCDKYGLSYSRTTLNKKLVNCKSSLGIDDAKCLDCESCFTKGFNPIYFIHNPISIKNGIELLKRRSEK